jgi:hypothetical protein
MQATKNLIAAFAIAIFTFTAVQAQVSLGIKTGYTINNVYTTEGLGAIAPNFEAIDGFQIGALVDIPVGAGFSFQPELNFQRKGFSLSEGLDATLLGVNVPVGATADTRIAYLDAPLLMKYTFGQDALKAYVAAGPTFGYATGGHIRTRAKALLEFDLGTVDLDLDNLNYERWEVGGALAAGLEMDLNEVTVFTDVRYQRGFTELYDIPLVNERVRNTGIAVSAGLRFNL